MDIAALWRQYGWGLTLFVVLWAERDKIFAFLGKAVAAIAPTLAERIKARRNGINKAHELAQHQLDHNREIQQTERIDTILMLKDLILQYRNELDDAKSERHKAENDALDVVRGYERLSAQVVEVLRDISDAIRAQTTRLDKLQEAMNERIANKT